MYFSPSRCWYTSKWSYRQAHLLLYFLYGQARLMHEAFVEYAMQLKLNPTFVMVYLHMAVSTTILAAAAK